MLTHQQSQGSFSQVTPLVRPPATAGVGGQYDPDFQGVRGNIDTGSVVSSSVFSGAQSHPAATSAAVQSRPRDRAQTAAGGIPSPYEVPGSTLPRGEHAGRSFSVSAQSQGAPRDYYPPGQSPPSSVVAGGHEPLEVFGRAPPPGLHQPIPQQRTGLGVGYPTTSPPHHPRGTDTILECSGEVVYIEQPLEDGLHHHDAGQLDPYSVVGGAGGAEYTNGSILTTASSEHYSSYSEATDPSNSLAHNRMPPPPHQPYHPPPPRDRHRHRDSEFSETSSFSGSSGSLRARSPGRSGAVGWDEEYRRGGTSSDVGHQRERSVSPVDHRSEVGAMAYNRKQVKKKEKAIGDVCVVLYPSLIVCSGHIVSHWFPPPHPTPPTPHPQTHRARTKCRDPQFHITLLPSLSQ